MSSIITGLNYSCPSSALPTDWLWWKLQRVAPAYAAGKCFPRQAQAFDSANCDREEPGKQRLCSCTKLESQTLCFDFRLLPELMVIGSGKSGTTTLFLMLRTSEHIVMPSLESDTIAEPWMSKELSIFNLRKRYLMGSEWWLHHYPICTEKYHEEHFVATDITPGYLPSPEAPYRISRRYGSLKNRLKFVVMLREPVERTYSLYMHFVDMPLIEGMSRPDGDFSAYLQKVFRAGNASSDFYLTDGLYTDALKRWLYIFRPSQFAIIPYRYLHSSEAGVAVVRSIWRWVGVPAGSASETRKTNVHHHRPVEEALDGPTLEQLKHFMLHTSAANLSKVLAANSYVGERPNLYKYTGRHRDEQEIKEWLEQHW